MENNHWHESSIGPRMNNAEQNIAILFERHDNHERVCADRYKDIKDAIFQIRETQKESIIAFREEMSKQWNKQEKMMQIVITVIITFGAAVEAARKFIGW